MITFFIQMKSQKIFCCSLLFKNKSHEAGVRHWLINSNSILISNRVFVGSADDVVVVVSKDELLARVSCDQNSLINSVRNFLLSFRCHGKIRRILDNSQQQFFHPFIKNLSRVKIVINNIEEEGIGNELSEKILSLPERD